MPRLVKSSGDGARKQEWYERARERRREEGIAVRDLMERLNYKSTSSILSIERGEISFPISRIQEYADAVNTNVLYLLGLSDNPSRFAKMTTNTIKFVETARDVYDLDMCTKSIYSLNAFNADFAFEIKEEALMNFNVGDVAVVSKDTSNIKTDDIVVIACRNNLIIRRYIDDVIKERFVADYSVPEFIKGDDKWISDHCLVLGKVVNLIIGGSKLENLVF